MKKVVILLAPTPPPAGGIASWTERMLATTLPEGWGLELVDTKLLSGDEVFHRKRRFVRELRRQVKILIELNKFLKLKSTVLVHSATPAGKLGLCREFLCLMLTKIYRKKYIVHYRCTLPNVIEDPVHQFLFKLTAKLSDYAIFLNENSSLFFKEHISGVPSGIVPNFIENSSTPREPKNIEDASTIKNLLFVGGVVASKGSYTLLEAARRLPNFNFNLVGFIDPAIKIESMPSNFILHGEKPKSEVEKEYQNNHIFLFIGNFRSEGFSNALVEAMSFGLPCIVSDWASNADMIEAEGGLVIPPNDVDCLVESIVRISRNTTFYNSASEWNLRKVRAAYCENVVVKKYFHVYESLALHYRSA